MKSVFRLHLAFAFAALALLSTLNSQLSTANAQGTAFSYQGQLQNNGLPTSGTFNFQFTLFNNSAGSGSPAAGPVTLNGVLVSNGLFAVAMDFGAGPWNGQSNWLEIAVEPGNSNTFTTLSPLQPITPVPYAIYAENAAVAASATTAVTANNVAGNSIIAGDITSGQVVKSLNGLHDAVSLSAGNNISVSSSGNTVTISGGAGWALTGNAGTSPGPNFVGTTDYNPLEMHVNGWRAYRLEPAGFNQPNVIGGSVMNADSGTAVTISGGYSNNIGSVFYSSVGGGYENIIQDGEAVIAGGWQNMIQSGGSYSAIGGGGNNTNASTEATIAGGAFNTIQSSAQAAGIAGGIDNAILTGANYAMIAGGIGNTNAAPSAAIGGGYENQIRSGAAYSVIGGGDGNWILTNSDTSALNMATMQNIPGAWATLDGGLDNTLGSGGSFIGGGFYNWIQTNSIEGVIFPNFQQYTGGWSVLGGGAQNTISAGTSFIGGGGFNWIEPNATWSVIGGGQANIIDTNCFVPTLEVYGIQASYYNLNNLSGGFSSVGGGAGNKIRSDTSFIGGGLANLIDLHSSLSAVGGGLQNTISNSSQSFIGGGGENTIGQNGASSTIAGGGDNTILGEGGFIGGGLGNTISNQPQYATISGGTGNMIGGNKSAGTIPGGFGNVVTGQYSFAAGELAQCTNDFSFVWSDGHGFEITPSTSGAAYSTGPDQFIIGASGGVGINTPPTNNVLFGTFGTLPFDVTTYHGIYAPYLYLTGSQGIYVPNGLGIFNNVNVNNTLNAMFVNGIINGSSDRNLKDHFAPIKTGDILDKVVALPITQWDFKADEQARHLGPMAQDFHKVFGLNGGDDKHIGVLDEGGVALAAIQGLNEKVEGRMQNSEARIQTLETENTKLQAQVAELRAMVMQLAQSKSK